MRKVLGIVMLLSLLAFGLNEELQEFALFGKGAGASGDYGTFALWGNPAGISKGVRMSAIASWQNSWGVSEYSQYVVGGLYANKIANIGLSLNYFGDADIYSELVVGATVARKLPRIYGVEPALGARMRYTSISCPEPYGSASTALFDGGLSLFFSSRASIGIYGQNLLNTQLVGFDINSMYSFGFRFDAASWATVYADLQVPNDAPGELYLCQQVALTKWLKVSLGIGGRPTKFYLGADFAWQDLGIGWGGTIHPELGMSNGAKILWEKR
ncbi:hypothetical protein J7L68_08140 [bacterium]|nr:hypothetical protein [bacterium]